MCHMKKHSSLPPKTPTTQDTLDWDTLLNGVPWEITCGNGEDDDTSLTPTTVRTYAYRKAAARGLKVTVVNPRATPATLFIQAQISPPAA